MSNDLLSKKAIDKLKEPLLACQNLSIAYKTRRGEVPAVEDFNLIINKGEAVGLVGESGCGKSTVANALMCYLGRNGYIKAGDIRFQGKSILGLDEKELRHIRGKDIAMVYQDPMAALNPSLKVSKQLSEVPLAHESGISKKEAYDRAREMLTAVRLPDTRRIMEAYPHQLSGGQQQRVIIAMALLSNPALLILDEPTTALDVTVEAGIIELIRDMTEEFQTSLLFISHNLGLVLDTCDNVSVMYAGQIVEEGESTACFDKPYHPYTHGLFDCIPSASASREDKILVSIPGSLPTADDRPPGCVFAPRCKHFVSGRCDIAVPPLETVNKETRQSVRCVRWDEIRPGFSGNIEMTPPPEIGEPLLEAEGLIKYYKVRDRSLKGILSGQGTRFVKANEEVSLKIKQCETLAIVGESGCGKSTFAKVVVGLEEATGGKVLFANKEIGNRDVDDRTNEEIAAIQMIFQNPFETLNPSHSVGGQLARVVKKFGALKGRQNIWDRVMELMDMVKLPREFALRLPRQLSGGQKQRVAIARAFAAMPKMVVADEPLSALDVSVAAAVAQLLINMQHEHKTTLILISHDIGLVRYLADRVAVMYLGHVVEEGSVEDIFAPPYHPYTEALLSAVPIIDPHVKKRKILLEGNQPSALNPPKGCPFHTRCPRKVGNVCEEQEPPVRSPKSGHWMACHIPLEELESIGPVFTNIPEKNAAE